MKNIRLLDMEERIKLIRGQSSGVNRIGIDCQFNNENVELAKNRFVIYRGN